jgi:hypothetical protein
LPIIAGQREALAARAGAEVENLRAGLGAAEQRGQLRALVLHLDEAFHVGRLADSAGPRPSAVIGMRSPTGDSGVATASRWASEASARRDRSSAVDAQIDRRATGERPALVNRRIAKALGKPAPAIPDNRRARGRARRRGRQREALPLGLDEGRRRVASPVNSARPRPRRGRATA